MLKILLAGSPNVGKTSLYNKMTSSFAHTGNWHGVTVDKLSKVTSREGVKSEITDLPGLYSLTAYSPEEGVSRDQLITQSGCVVINVCDALNLARNLYLTLQLLELGKDIVIAVNMADELDKNGKIFDKSRIENALKLPVVFVSAKYGTGIDSLFKKAVEISKSGQSGKAGKEKTAVLPHLKNLPVKEIGQIIKNNAIDASLPLTYAAVKVMENDEFILSKLNLNKKQKEQIAAFGNLQDSVASARYAFIDGILRDCILDLKDKSGKIKEKKQYVKNEQTKTSGKVAVAADNLAKTNEKSAKNYGLNHIDKILLNKYLALPVFLIIMLLIFTVTFYIPGKWLSQGLEFLTDKFLYTPVMSLLGGNAPDWFAGLIGTGIIKGIGGVLVFLPQVTLLFLFLSVLEDSGYISRVAFMTDGIFRKIGLSGRSAFTLLTGLGCSAAAVLSARGLEDKNMRIKTVLITPFMSCSARLPVYLLIVARFFAGNPLVIFALYILGAVIALFFAAVMGKTKRLKSAEGSFVMEMPPYRLPSFRRALRLIFHNIKSFLARVGTVVLAFGVIIWFLSSFSFTEGFIGGAESGGLDGGSILAVIAKFIAPVFKPLGFGSPEAATALFSGLAAKEIILSTIESLGGVGVLFTGENAALCALSFLVFVLLYVPCFATLAAVGKEIGFKWALFSFLMQTATAYLFSLFVYTFGLLFIRYPMPAFGVLALAFLGVFVLLFYKAFVYFKGVRKKTLKTK